MSDAEIIDITNLDEPSISLNDSNFKSSNFGAGIELLMNGNKLKNASEKSNPGSEIDINDLKELENELNVLSDDIDTSKPILNDMKSDIFSKPIKINFNENLSNDNINDKSSDKPIKLNDNFNNESDKTWDGYGKFNNVPVDPDRSVKIEPQLNKDEMIREKFKYLKKLEILEDKGIKLSKKYNMESSLLEMKGEYETHLEEKEKHNSVKFQGKMLMAMITGIEFLNNRFDPFDVKLDGWSEQVNENVDDYDEIFTELHEKYKSKASMAPELKLLFQLGGSAMMVHMTNTMFKSSIPGMDDIMKQNPELMQQFTQAAVNSMGATNPGFAGFANSMMGNNNIPQDIPVMNQGPPPQAMATQGPLATPPPIRSGHIPLSNRPDLSNSRQSYTNNNVAEKTKRREMKGPSDITGLLSGLKTKSINVDKEETGSTISISELKELQNEQMPTRTKRRQKSDKNTVSLDI